jgi:ComF family protein
MHTASTSELNLPEAQEKAGLLLSNHLIRRWLRLGLDLLFPPRCAGCGRVDAVWCAQCQHVVHQVPFPIIKELDADIRLDGAAATGLHKGKLQRAIWSLKFENGTALAQPLGERLADCLNALKWSIDLVVPVPLHAERLRERGYNQAELLACTVAASSGVMLSHQAVWRTVSTQSQVGLTAQARKQNMQGVFTADPTVVAERAVLMIDDVLTTGATLGACAQAAREAGAAAVYGLTVTMA